MSVRRPVTGTGRARVPVPVRYRCMYVCACRCVTVCEAEESPVWLCPLPRCRLGIVVDCRVSTDWSAFPRVSGFAFRSAATVGVGRFFSLPRVFRVRFYANCALRDVRVLSPETGQCCMGYEERTLERVPTYAATNKNGPVERHGSPTGQNPPKAQRRAQSSNVKGSKRPIDVTVTGSRARDCL